MKKNFPSFIKSRTKNFFTALANLFIFLPYFFSVPQLLKSLFAPWKKLIAKKTAPGFSFQQWLSVLAFNLVSSGIGFLMRASIITFYFFSQGFFVVVLPFVTLLFFILFPFSYILYLLEPSQDEKREILKSLFLKNHLLVDKNRKQVEEWFESYYKKRLSKKVWWKLENLFSIPPLARDWSVGYTPTLDQFSDELTIPKAHFKNLINREKELKQIEQVLSRSQEANLVIVGEEGVGKHTIVEGLAKRIYEGKTNPILAYKRIIKLDMEKVTAQSEDFSQKEELFKTLLKEAEEAGNIIILIDNFDQYVASGAERINLTNVIEPFAKSDKIQFIGISTPFFFQKFIFANEKIKLLFDQVDVYEIDFGEAEKILLDIAFDFEARFNVAVPYETLKEVVKKSAYYITHIPFPEKAIELLDETCVYAVQSSKTKGGFKLTPAMVDTVLTQKTHIPVTLDQSLKDKLLSLEKKLAERIVFQEEPIKKLASTLRKSFVVAAERKKPLASFLFLGPTGVGKTETAKALSEVFFGSSSHLLRFDMSFYQTKQDIANLLGSQETGNPGFLTKGIREKPYGVLLLDEIEKADPNLLNIFLTLLDEGYITDGFGKRVDSKNLIVIATSNAGSDLIYKKELEAGELIDYLIEQKIFSPEFINRFDGTIIYQPLTKEAVFEIARKKLAQVKDEVRHLHQVEIKISNQFVEQLVEKGYHVKFGARNLERVIRDEVEDKVARLVLENKVKEGEVIEF